MFISLKALSLLYTLYLIFSFLWGFKGKTTLADRFVASNGIISSRLAGKVILFDGNVPVWLNMSFDCHFIETIFWLLKYFYCSVFCQRL